MTDRAKILSPEHLKASVMEAIGKLTGDTQVAAEGRRQKRAARSPKQAEPGTD